MLILFKATKARRTGLAEVQLEEVVYLQTTRVFIPCTNSPRNNTTAKHTLAPSPRTPPPPSRWSRTPEARPPLPQRQPRIRRTHRSTCRQLSSRLSSCRRRTLHACAALRTSCHSCNVTCHPEAGHVIVAKITRGGRTCTVSESCLGS